VDCIIIIIRTNVGVGWAMVMVSTLCCIYYNMIIAYTIYYICASFTAELPWSSCKDEWLPRGCRDYSNLSLINQTGRPWKLAESGVSVAIHYRPMVR
jgi:hypothetical protein